MNDVIFVRHLNCIDYRSCWEAMRKFTDERTNDTADEFWVVEHFPVFTQGQNGKLKHILNAGDIPVIQSDRGGQVTYHGPGQLVIYPLIDIERKKINIRDLVTSLENAVIDLLKSFNIAAFSKREAPGVYVDHKKICSIGLRVRRGRAYHGLALNVNMDLEPFSRINPCGFENLKMSQLSDFGVTDPMEEIGTKLIHYLINHLGYEGINR